MEASSLAGTLARLVQDRTSFSIVIGGVKFFVAPRQVYIPSPQFDTLAFSLTTPDLPDEQRVVRKSSDSIFHLVGYVNHRPQFSGSSAQRLIFGAPAVDALTYDPHP